MNRRGSQDKPAAGGRGPGAAASSAELPPSFFQTVVETANEGIWMIDPEGRTTFANERMGTMLAVAPEQMLGRHPSDYLLPEDLPKAVEIIRRTLGGEAQEFEIRFRKSDGSELVTLAGSAPIRDESGAIVGAVATFSDLTARKAAEAALSQSEQEAKRTAALLNKLLESATDGIWLRDVEGRFQLANTAARSIMGRTEEDLVGAPLREVWPPAIADRLEAETAKMLSSRRGVTVEEDMFDAGKQRVGTFLSNKVPVFDADGSAIGILGISRDISERKTVENELRSSREQLSQQVAELNGLYGSAPLGLAFFDREYRYLRINEELANINGRPAADHIGRTIAEVLPRDARVIEPIIDRVFATGEPVRDIEVTTESPDSPGGARHWLTGFYPVRATSGEVDAVGAWIIEISERKAAEQRELLLAREVDHRAKNLLAVVQSIVQLTPAEDAAELKESVVGRIQALARAHSLLSESRWEGVDLGELVEEELAPFPRSQANRVNRDGPALKLRPAAAQSLALVLHELATNAAKYGALSSHSGRLDVRWQRVEDEAGSFIEVRWVESGGPPAVKPEALGFGSSIIRASVERQLRGKVSKDWRAEGLACTIRIPAAEAVRGGE